MIKSAAIRKCGIIYTGNRHCDILYDAYRTTPRIQLGTEDSEQGFVTNTGEFVTREEGAKIAFECGQISEPKETLYSEDYLYTGKKKFKDESEFYWTKDGERSAILCARCNGENWVVRTEEKRAKGISVNADLECGWCGAVYCCNNRKYIWIKKGETRI